MPNLKFKSQLLLLFFLLISLALYILGKQIPREAITEFIKNAGPWGPIVYIIIHQISFVVAPISGLPFLVAGFYLFGKNVVIYSYFVQLIGSSINFAIAKKWGRPIVEQLAGKEALNKIDSLSNTYGKLTLFTLRLLQGGIGDFVSYAYGLTPMKFRVYITITAFAVIPGNLLWYIVISKTNSVEQSVVASLILAAISITIFVTGNYTIKAYKKMIS